MIRVLTFYPSGIPDPDPQHCVRVHVALRKLDRYHTFLLLGLIFFAIQTEVG
jgi:hypothetical protein